MSRSVWVTKPTPDKARRLMEIFEDLWSHGVTDIKCCMMFSGYLLERVRQSGSLAYSGAFKGKVVSYRRGKRTINGKNADNHLATFTRHCPYIRDRLAMLLANDISVNEEVPWFMLADMLVDRGRHGDAAVIREMYQEDMANGAQ